MDTNRRTGLILAAVSTVLWAVVVVAMVTTAPEEGANIGAGLLAFLAVPLSIGASGTLLASWRSDVGAARPDEHARARRIGALLAGVSIVCLPGTLLLGPSVESLELAIAAGVVFVIGLVAFVASAVLFALPRHRDS